MSNHMNLIIILLTMLSLNSIALADPGDNNKNSRFMRFFDTNNDKTVTREELNKASRNRFSEMDTDRDNLISATEFKHYFQQRRQNRRTKKYKMIDGDADGLMTKDEFLTFKYKRASERFHGIDVDEDGIVSLEEFVAAKPRRHGKRFRTNRGKRFFSKLDTNSNGEVTRDESLAAWTNWFNRIDENNDKTVTMDEVKLFRSKKW